jgi:predicted acyltransferase
VVIGILLDAVRTRESDRRANLWLGAAGAALAFGAWRASFLPPVDPRSAFWTTSASFFFIRLGLMIGCLTAAYVWEQRPGARRWSPLQVFGRSSLFVYWIHVEMVYGLVSLPLHQAFSLTGAWIALAIFCLFILACVVGKDRLVNRRRGSPLTREKAFAYMGSSAGGVKP